MKKLLLMATILAMGTSAYAATGSFAATATVSEALVFTVSDLEFGAIGPTMETAKANTNTANFALAGASGAGQTALITMESTSNGVGSPNNSNGSWSWPAVTGGSATGSAALTVAVSGVTSWNSVTLDLSGTFSGTILSTGLTVGNFSETIDLTAEYN